MITAGPRIPDTFSTFRDRGEVRSGLLHADSQLLLIAQCRQPLKHRRAPRGTTRPWCVEAVFLFDARQLRSEQIMRGAVASSVIKQQWAAAEVYPRPPIRSGP